MTGNYPSYLRSHLPIFFVILGEYLLDNTFQLSIVSKVNLNTVLKQSFVGVPQKNAVLEILQNSQEKTCTGVFFNKVTASLKLYYKRDSSTDVFL